MLYHLYENLLTVLSMWPLLVWQRTLNSTECVTDLDKQTKRIIFQLLLISFEANIIFWGIWGSSGNQLKPSNSKFNQVKLAQILDTHCTNKQTNKHTNKHTHTQTNKHTHAYKHTQTHTYTYRYTHTHILSFTSISFHFDDETIYWRTKMCTLRNWR